MVSMHKQSLKVLVGLFSSPPTMHQVREVQYCKQPAGEREREKEERKSHTSLFFPT